MTIAVDLGRKATKQTKKTYPIFVAVAKVVNVNVVAAVNNTAVELITYKLSTFVCFMKENLKKKHLFLKLN